MNKKRIRTLASTALVCLVLTTALFTEQVKAGETGTQGVNAEYKTVNDHIAAQVAESAVKNYPNGAEIVVVVGEGAYADFASAQPLAKALGAAVLVTDSKELSPETTAALDKLGTKKIIAVGGTAIMTPEVVREMMSHGRSMEQLGGNDRVGTNEAVNLKLVAIGTRIDNAYVVDGYNMTDTLVAGNVAASGKGVIVIGSSDQKDVVITENELSDMKPQVVTYVGDRDTVVHFTIPASTSTEHTNASELVGHFNKGKAVLAATPTPSEPHVADGMFAAFLAGEENAPLEFTDSNDTRGILKSLMEQFAKDGKLIIIGVIPNSDYGQSMQSDFKAALDAWNGEIVKAPKLDTTPVAINDTVSGGLGQYTVVPSGISSSDEGSDYSDQTGIILSGSYQEVAQGSTITLQASIASRNLNNENFVWGTDNSTVATVSNGVVTGVAQGIANIWVRTTDGSKTTACAITVLPYTGIIYTPIPPVNTPVLTVSVTGVNVQATASVTTGSTISLQNGVVPNNATNTNVTWSTDNSAVATVVNGVVKGVAVGTANIRVTTVDGSKTATCAITVSAPVSTIAVTSVNLQPQALVVVGSTRPLDYGVFPYDATNTNVTWSTDNPAVATVANGAVTGGALGSANIRVTTVDGSKTATCAVTVAAPVSTIAVIGVNVQATASVTTGASISLQNGVIPNNATNTNVIWTTDNSAVATVVNGVVTGVAPGVVKISIITEDGGYVGDCTITVTRP